MIFLVLFSLDQLTKWWAEQRGLVSYNAGIAFGWGSEWVTTGLLTLVALGLLAKAKQSRLPTWLIASFFAGAFSNLWDRWLTGGKVRDWLAVPGLNLHNNLADWFIFGAVLLYVLKYAYEHRNFIRRR